MGFAHLHNHTPYSLQDAVNKIDGCLQYVKELGQTACAITDHGNMYGVIQFYKKAKELGIKPIIGCEVYITDKDHRIPERAEHAKYYHLILLAENNQGYQNLIKLCSLGFTEGFYSKPRIDHALLKQYHEGLICLSACIGGEVPNAVLRGELMEAKRIIMEHVEIFGEGNYFLELQNHGTREEALVASELYRLSKELHVPVVVTNDCHYTRKEDRRVHDTLLCIRSQKSESEPVLLHNTKDPRRYSYSGDGYYMKSEEEMRELFPWCPEGIENTGKIAERCNVEFTFHETKMPSYAVPEGLNTYSYLEKLCLNGIPERYPERTEEQEHEIRSKMEYELSVIRDMGYLEYFLIVWDFIHWAKTNGILVGPGRGSAAGSIVSYLTGITDIDPIRYGLLFQRFLNPERVSMPDIDVDFCKRNRYKVLEYVKQKYGEDSVCQIITFGTFGAKQAIRDVGKCLGMSPGERDAVAKLIPEEPGMTLKKACEDSQEFRAAMDAEQELYELASAIEGLPRHTSTHAAGVIICDRDVSDYIPLSIGSGEDGEKLIQSQYNMVEIEELGLLKMDFLGLRTLTAIDETRKMIQRKSGEVPEMDYSDQAVYEMIATGETTGIFQLESKGMQDFMKELQPNCVEDLIAGIALYRPGPMDFIPAFLKGKHGECIQYDCPQMEPILKATYGCIVYQEQVMQIFRDLAGYSLGRSDIVRRAMSKKKASILEAERKVFLYGDEEDGIAGCIKNGIPEKTAKEIYEKMVDFAKYAFNKSHAAAYAIVLYQTAWYMHYYPVEYSAALMTSVIENRSKVGVYAEAAKRKGIELKPVDILLSQPFFQAFDSHILFAVQAVRDIGADCAERFCALRDMEPKAIASFREALELLLSAGVSSKGVEALANAGAFSMFGGTRKEYASSAKAMMESIKKEKKSMIQGQMSLFEWMGEEVPELTIPKVGEYGFLEGCEKEKSACGLYVTMRPTDGFRTSARLVSEKFPYYVTGIVKEVKYHNSWKGLMAFVTVEQENEEKDYVIFPEALRKYGECISKDTFVLMRTSGDNIIESAIAFRELPANVWVRTSKEAAKEAETWIKEKIKERAIAGTGRDSIRIFVDKDLWFPVVTGNFKEEVFLSTLREHFGKDNVEMLLVKDFRL